MDRLIATFGITLVLLLASGQAMSQDDEHVKWTSAVAEGKTLLITAQIDPGWHLYSSTTPEGGPMPVNLSLQLSPGVRLDGHWKEFGTKRVKFDSTFMVPVHYYETGMRFQQSLKVKKPGTVTVTVKYSVCSEEECVPGEFQFVNSVVPEVKK